MTKKGARGVGRPRSIDLETLLDAACEMGLGSLSMKELAERLGVGVATVYRYVRDRTELVRLASARSVHRSFPPDKGQPWHELVRGYADSIYSALSASPILLQAYISGQIGPQLEVEFADSFVAMMRRRAFRADEAVEIFHAMGVISVGAAVATAHAVAARSRHGSFRESVHAALDTRSADELRELRGVLETYIAIAGQPSLDMSIKHLVLSIAATRGETLSL